MRRRADVPDPGGRPPPPYFNISPDEALAELDAAGRHRRLRRHRRACAQGRARPGRPRPRGERRRAGCGCFSTWEITRYLIPVAPAHFRRVLRANPALPQGRSETAGRRQVVHPRRGAAAARAFRRRGQPRQGVPPLPPGRAAGQGRARSPTSRAASARPRRRRTSRCRRRSTATGCWSIDLDSQGSMTSIFGGTGRLRMGHRLPADRARLRARAAGREPPPGRARRRAAAARGHARRGAEAHRRRTSSRRPTGRTST